MAVYGAGSPLMMLFAYKPMRFLHARIRAPQRTARRRCKARHGGTAPKQCAPARPVTTSCTANRRPLHALVGAAGMRRHGLSRGGRAVPHERSDTGPASLIEGGATSCDDGARRNGARRDYGKAARARGRWFRGGNQADQPGRCGVQFQDGAQAGRPPGANRHGVTRPGAAPPYALRATCAAMRRHSSIGRRSKKPASRRACMLEIRMLSRT